MGRRLPAGVAGGVGVAAVVATQLSAAAEPWWLGLVGLAAGIGLALSGAAALAVGVAGTGWLFVAAALSWSATTTGLQTGGLTRALLVHIVVSCAVRGTDRGRVAARVVTGLAYACAIPGVDARTWPVLLVAVGVAAVPRSRGGWPSAVGLLALLGLRAFVAGTGLLTTAQVEIVVVVYAVAATLVGVGSVHAVRPARPRRHDVITQAVALADVSADDRLGAALAAALGDPGTEVILEAGRLRVRSVVLDRDPSLAGAVADVLGLVETNRSLGRDLDRTLSRMHESSARILTAEHDQAAALRRRLDNGPRHRLRVVAELLEGFPAVEPEVAQRLARTREHLARADDGLVAIAGAAAPALESVDDLRSAVECLAGDLVDDAVVDIEAARLSPVIATTVWFVCAEALTNVAKHSAGTSVRILVRSADHRVTAEVADTGVGSADPDGAGLRGLRDRVTALGGQLQVHSPAGGGTTVRAELPI